MTINESDLATMAGRSVTGSDGEKIGSVGQVYLDDQTGRPEWVTVMTGLFGTKESFVPVRNADVTTDTVRVPFDKDKVKDAPRVDADQGHLSPDEEAELYRYYGMDFDQSADYQSADYRSGQGEYATGTEYSTREGSYDQAATEGRDTSGPNTDDAMTRSEERLKVGTEQREAGRARLRKYIVTEQQTVTVPVQREEVRLEREPITEANRGSALSGPDLSEEEHEVILHEERPVVQKEAVPVERVRLATETVTDEVQVSEELRKEQIDTEGLEVEGAGTQTTTRGVDDLDDEQGRATRS